MKNFLLLLFTLIITINALAKSEITAPGDSIVLYAIGLVNPIGIEVDSESRLWVAEQGTGNNDSRISIVTTNGVVHPFMVGLPSQIIEGFPGGARHVYFDIDGKLLIVQGEGSDTLSESILVVDTTGFTPGDPPLGRENIEAYYNIGEFSLNNGGSDTNPYTLTIGPNNDWFIVDAGFNGIIKRERTTGDLSVFVNFGSNIVPTGSVFTGDKFYVGNLTGFPFPVGGAKIYEVDLTGNFSVFQENLTTIVELDVDPLDNKLVCLQFAHFSAGFQLGTGAVFKIDNGTADTLVFGFNLSAGMRFNSKGDLFVATYADGEIYKIFAKPTDADNPNETVETFNLMQNYPNPFNPSTTISWQLAERSNTTLKIYDVLGNEVKTLVNEEQSEGIHQITFDASGFSSGVYFYKINAISDNKEYSAVKKLMILK